MVKVLDTSSGFNQWNANRNATERRRTFPGFVLWFMVFMLSWWAIGLIMGPRSSETATSEIVSFADASSVPVSTVSSDVASVSVRGLRISDVVLTGFASDTSGSDSVTLLDGDNEFIELGMITTGTTAPVATTVWSGDNGEYKWRNADGVEFVRTVRVEGYLVRISDTVRNTTSNTISVTPYARTVRGGATPGAAGVQTGGIVSSNGDVTDVPWKRLDKKSYAYSTTRGFAGFADQYWQTVVSLNTPDQTISFKRSGDLYTSDTASGAVMVAPGSSATMDAVIYAGPRDQSILNSYDSVISGLGETIDYGWFWFLARPMLWVLNGIHHLVMNYGVAIIIMTILLRLMMWPLTRKSYTSMAAMQRMQPELQRIQKLYANDKARLQMEMLKLYQTHHTSPMSGCLPMLIQIPIFFALYKALLVSVQMRHAHFLWITDLSAMDPYFILPILMGATMWLQQRLQSASRSRSAARGDDAIAQTQRMMKWMPVLFTVMFAWMPAGLVLYWTVSNIFGIIQMQIIRRRMK
ncbi:MAG: membrane protein insertase YidC [Alphaproteobacteria bacterium]|nr:membrane protein insertase YidC [Alphaproteobacteria bacterium]